VVPGARIAAEQHHKHVDLVGSLNVVSVRHPQLAERGEQGVAFLCRQTMSDGVLRLRLAPQQTRTECGLGMQDLPIRAGPTARCLTVRELAPVAKSAIDHVSDGAIAAPKARCSVTTGTPLGDL
jgi:hypothetical protein